jgi:hypothetical protein
MLGEHQAGPKEFEFGNSVFPEERNFLSQNRLFLG